MDALCCSWSPKILVNQMNVWPRDRELLGTGLGKRIPRAYLGQFLFLRGPAVGSDNSSWLCVSEQRRMDHTGSGEMQNCGLLCIWAETLGF